MDEPQISQTPVEFPLSRKSRRLWLATALCNYTALALIAVICLCSVVVMVDDSSRTWVQSGPQDPILLVIAINFAIIAVFAFPYTVLRAAAQAAGRRDLYLAADAQPADVRPTDEQMVRYLHDAYPWELPFVFVAFCAGFGAFFAFLTALAAYFVESGYPRVGHVLLGLAFILTVIWIRSARTVTHLTRVAKTSYLERERRWPLPRGSQLGILLMRGGDSSGSSV